MNVYLLESLTHPLFCFHGMGVNAPIILLNYVFSMIKVFFLFVHLSQKFEILKCEPVDLYNKFNAPIVLGLKKDDRVIISFTNDFYYIIDYP
jgi:hypothetical protein